MIHVLRNENAILYTSRESEFLVYYLLKTAGALMPARNCLPLLVNKPVA